MYFSGNDWRLDPGWVKLVIMECEARSDGRLERGNAKRRVILDRAVDLASVSGLDGLSIGRLATELGISKSGAVLHFGSKQDLQLSVIEHAADRFIQAVIVPAMAESAGRDRLWRLADGWLRHIEAEIFPGGCFFSTVGAEFTARPGPVSDAIMAVHRRWVDLLEQQARTAREAGDLAPRTDPRRLAFEIDALIRQANVNRRLPDGGRVIGYARQAVRELLHHDTAD